MATNQVRWVGNVNGATEPLLWPGNFAKGDTAAIHMGELLELTGNTNTEWVPMDSDFAGSGNVAIAAEEIKAGDRAGYYKIIVPRPGDLFRFELAAAHSCEFAHALYYSSSEKLTITAGTNILAYAAGVDYYPPYQGHLADDASGDVGTTIRSAAWVTCTIRLAYSYYAAIFK